MSKYIIIITSLICAHAALATDFPEFPFVSAEGISTTNIAPDVAVIDLTVFCHDKISSNATTSVENRCIDLISSLQNDFGIAQTNITATNIDKSPVRREESYARLEILGYDVRRRITIEVNNIEMFPSIMRMLSSTDLITYIDADFKRSDEEAILRDLTAQACKNAQKEASLLANSTGNELGSLFAISIDDMRDLAVKFRPYSSRRSVTMFGYSSSGSKKEVPFFAPDTIGYEASVATIYKLK